VNRRWTGPGVVAAAAVAFAYLVSRQDWWAAALARLFPSLPQTIFPSATVAELVGQHLQIVLLSSAITLLVGIPLGIWVTRPSGEDFRELVAAAVDFGQTFPPIAVLALLLSILGFYLWPAIVALSLYGLFPVVSNTVAGIDALPPAVLDAARGMGMGRWRILFTVELPLAARVIMAGVRTSVIINIGTATVAAATGVGGLGSPIYNGINTQNGAFVLEGAAAAAMLAVLADALLAQVERALTPAA
jgi:osmoprotectant transport system permease protein